MGLNAEIVQFYPEEILISKTSATIRDIEILDHIKTSTWKKFLTSLHSDSRGNIRETDSDMVRIELRGVRPSPGHASEEARLRVSVNTFQYMRYAKNNEGKNFTPPSLC